MTKQQNSNYNNESITSLKGADRVRLRPGVIFGSDGLDGCAHAFFEILSNSVDEAREGHGNIITVTAYNDLSIEVDDRGRGVPLGYNEKEGRWNWDLIYCELYAGGKYDTNDGGNYEYSLGLNGLGLCATQYASEYMDAEIHTGGFKYLLHFEKGEIAGEMQKEPYNKKDTGTRIGGQSAATTKYASITMLITQPIDFKKTDQLILEFKKIRDHEPITFPMVINRNGSNLHEYLEDMQYLVKGEVLANEDIDAMY